MTTDYAALLARLNAQRAADRAAAWERGKPRQRAADKRRRVAKAKAAYQAMPKLKPEALPIPKTSKAERRPPTPPEGNSGIKAARRASGVPEAPWVNPRPPTPAPGREPFDTLFTDIRNLRGDLRLVRRAIRGNTVPCVNRDTLMDKLGSLLDLHDEYKAKRGPLKAARLMLEAVRAIMDADNHNRRRDRQEYRDAHGYGSRGPIPARVSAKAGFRLDARELAQEYAGYAGSCFGWRTITYTDGVVVSIGISRTAKAGARVAYVCPVCGRGCRYLYRRGRGAGCRRCARRI